MKHRARTYLLAVAIGLIAAACADKSHTSHDSHKDIGKEHQKEDAKWDCEVMGLIVMGSALCVNIAALFAVANRSKKRKLEVVRLRDELSGLRHKMTIGTKKYRELSAADTTSRMSAVATGSQSSDTLPENLTSAERDEKCLRERLVRKFREICPQLATYPPTKYAILADATYATIQSIIARGSSIPDTSPLWRDIEEMVLRESPDFKAILSMLVGGRMEEFNYQMALLIRCGIKPSKISRLVSKAKNSISTRRSKLTEEIFGDERNPKYFDYIVLLI